MSPSRPGRPKAESGPITLQICKDVDARACRIPARKRGGARRGHDEARVHCCGAIFSAKKRHLSHHPRIVRPPISMLQIEDLVFNAWGRRFFDQATVTLPKDAKVGLVGRNGVGKSTLFKLILGHHTPDGGDIRCRQIRPHRLGRSGAPGDAGQPARHRAGRRCRARTALTQRSRPPSPSRWARSTRG